jgi:uncharacterized protein
MAEPQKAFNESDLSSKERNLRDLMRHWRRVLVAYSGGVDSAYLAFVANDELGGNALCITGISPSVARAQRDEAGAIAAELGLNHRTVPTDELSDPAYAANPTNRCYHCKSELYRVLGAIAAGESYPVVVDGANADDAVDYRPGALAATEMGVRSPLLEVGLTKVEIRELSRRAGVPRWDKPASPCLSSRLAYGVPVTIGRLSKIERGEAFLRSLGFREFRVRVHDELARIEIAPDELYAALNAGFAATVAEKFERIGFRFVTLDLKGFRSGALNRSSPHHTKRPDGGARVTIGLDKPFTLFRN